MNLLESLHEALLKAAKSDSSEVASIAVKNGPCILMGKRRDNNRWTLPGGHLDKGEEKEQGAVRELFEESGISADAKELKHLGSEDVVTHSGKNKKIHAFHYDHKGEKPTTKNDPDKEVHKWEWIDVSKGLPKEVSENLHSPKNLVLTHLGLLGEENLEKACEDLVEALLKGRAVPIGSTSPDGNWIKTATGWRHKVTGQIPHSVTLHTFDGQKHDEHTVHGVMGRHHGEVQNKMHGVIKNLRGRKPNMQITRMKIEGMSHPPKTSMKIAKSLEVVAHFIEAQNLFDGMMGGETLEKAQIMSSVIGANINTNDAVIDEMGSRSNSWFAVIEEAVKNLAPLSDSVKLMIGERGQKELTVAKLDDGLFSAYVREADLDSGEFGKLLVRIPQVTIASIVSALKIKGYLPDVMEHVRTAHVTEFQPKSEEQNLAELDTVLREYVPTNPFAEEEFIFKSLAEALEKARPALPVGTIREWGGIKYVKHAEGWVVVGGQHHGKKMGKFGEESTHHEFADKYQAGAPEEAKDKQAEAEKPEAPEARPQFKTYAEAQAWIKEAAKKHKSRDEFLASPEYKEAYSHISGLHETEKREKKEADEQAKFQPPSADVALPEGKPTARERVGNPMESETPRKAAEAIEDDEEESEYEFARKSKFGNKGEDLKDSARHKRNEWKGLEAAEKDGTAEEMVKRDVLLKQDPIDFQEHLTKDNILGPLTAYMVLSKFPSTPVKGEKFGARNLWVNKETGKERYLSPMYSPVGEEWEKKAQYSDKDAAKFGRKEYVEAFDRVKKKAAGLRAEGDMLKVIEGVRSEVKAIINDLRDKDSYSPTANALVRFHNNVLATSAYRASKTSVLAEMAKFVKNGKTQYGEHVLESNGNDMVEHARDIMEGTGVDKAFGKSKDRKDEFSPAELYVKKAERQGPEIKGLKTAEAQEKELLTAMKLRGLQWGNSVTDDERKHHLEQSSLAFSDLADVLGLPKEMVSFNGRLGLAIGARGHGTALAHYEPSTKVINLTRKSGVGSLAHEWGHMFDNVLAELHGSRKYLSTHAKAGGALNDSPVAQAMKDLVTSDGWQEFITRMRKDEKFRKLSEGKKEYWDSTLENFARSFERYVQHKLEKSGRKNTYLSGVDPHAFWPNDSEIEKMAPAFDKVFSEFKGSEYLKKAWMAVSV